MSEKKAYMCQQENRYLAHAVTVMKGKHNLRAFKVEEGSSKESFKEDDI